MIVTVVWIAFATGLYVWMALALMAVFRKTGVRVWRAWVPVVNAWTLFELAAIGGWWAIVLLGGAIALSVVPLGIATILLSVAFAAFSLALEIRMLLGIGRGFRVAGGYVVLGVLLLPVWASVLGWGPARWAGSRPVVPAAYSAGPGAYPAGPGYPPPPLPPAPYPPAGHPAPPVPPRPPVPPVPPAAAAAPPVPPAPAPVLPVPPAARPEEESEGLAWLESAVAHTATDGAPASAESARAAADPPFGSRRAPITPVGPVSAFGDASAVSPDTGSEPVAYGPRRGAPQAPPDDLDDLDEQTAVGDRHRRTSLLVLPDGTLVQLLREAALLGRNPLPRTDSPHAQLIPIADPTRTVSKTHALLRRTDDGWEIRDLESTNGIVLVDAAGVESELATPAAVTEYFFLGDAELRLRLDG
ncbi:FHA domain-containing protein [Microbacterium sp. X-17]|uniref:FHA domain-containing protein n=1 Tax=Microbacterium sp. X-17 TaxID=3144404 RepID=UPI0031F4E462